MADIFSEINNASLSPEEKQSTVFLDHNKIWVFKQKLAFWKSCILICKNFPDEISDQINECAIFDIVG